VVTSAQDTRVSVLARVSDPSRSITAETAACLALTSALIHVVAAPEHLRSWPAAGVFFVGLALVQFALTGMLLLRRAAVATVLVGLWIHVGVIVLYVIDRTAGLPFTPAIAGHGGRPSPGRSIVPGAVEGVGSLDFVALIAELALVVLLVAMLPAKPRRLAANGLVAGGLAMWALAVIGVLA
jgi:hypothetical protein